MRYKKTFVNKKIPFVPISRTFREGELNLVFSGKTDTAVREGTANKIEDV